MNTSEEINDSTRLNYLQGMIGSKDTIQIGRIIQTGRMVQSE
jgi:hypothetical protein